MPSAATSACARPSKAAHLRAQCSLRSQARRQDVRRAQTRLFGAALCCAAHGASISSRPSPAVPSVGQHAELGRTARMAWVAGASLRGDAVDVLPADDVCALTRCLPTIVQPSSLAAERPATGAEAAAAAVVEAPCSRLRRSCFVRGAEARPLEPQPGRRSADFPSTSASAIRTAMLSLCHSNAEFSFLLHQHQRSAQAACAATLASPFGCDDRRG